MATTDIYTYLHPLSLHDALPIFLDPSAPSQTASFPIGLNRGPLMGEAVGAVAAVRSGTASALINVARMVGATAGVAILGGLVQVTCAIVAWATTRTPTRSEEQPSELPSLMRISYAVFCLKKK